MAVPILLDCDPGTTTRSPSCSPPGIPAIDLRAITTVAGNGPLDKVTRNARSVATLAGLARRPDRRRRRGPGRAASCEFATDVHGESALDGPPLPEPAVPLDPRPAPS